MSVIVNIDHSTGDLSQWTTVVTDVGSGSAVYSGSAGMGGTSNGLAITVDSAGPNYADVVFTDFGTDEGNTACSARFYFDPNGMVMADNDQYYILQFREVNGGTWVFARVALLYTTAAGLQIYANVRDDGGSWHDTNPFAISDEPHYIEINVKASSANTVTDAVFNLYIDGTLKQSVTSFEIHDKFQLDTVRAHSGGVDAGTSGTHYLDQLIVNDDGSLIGEHRESEITTLQPAGSGFVSNFISSETTDAETIYAAQGAGTNICLESVTINNVNPATVIIGAGSTGGSVDTEIIGPIDMTATGKPYEVQFTRPVVLDANTALTIDTGSAVLVQCTATGYVK